MWSHPLTVQTNHGIKAYVESSAFSLTSLKQQRILNILTQPHIAYVTDRVNMAERMKMIPPHSCVLEEEKEMKYKKYIQTSPLGLERKDESIHRWVLL